MRRIYGHVCGALAVTMLGAAPAAAQDWADDLAGAIERQIDAIARQVEHAVDHHIDHIFVSGARPLRYEMVDRRADYQGAPRYPSDHLPVRARLCVD